MHNRPFSNKETLAATYINACSWLGSIFDKEHKMWDQLTTFWSLDRAEKTLQPEGAAIKHASGQPKSLCKKGLLIKG